jgi:hypothetical protein
MPIGRSLFPLAVALVVARCGDPSQTAAVQQALTAAPHFVRWAGGTAPRFSATVTTASGGGLQQSAGPLRLDLSAPGTLSLDRYAVSFWAVRGAERSVQINYLSATGDTSSPFLQLTTEDPTYVPGQGWLAPGDSVLITVTVNPDTLKVSLEPTGLLFGTPAQLQVWYGGAGGDLNGDGVVDSVDTYIATNLLGMWYREGQDSSWAPISATQALDVSSFTSALPHFSEYAVSW